MHTLWVFLHQDTLLSGRRWLGDVCNNMTITACVLATTPTVDIHVYILTCSTEVWTVKTQSSLVYRDSYIKQHHCDQDV